MELEVPKQALLPADSPAVQDDDDLKLEIATQWQLMWWKFRKHHLAMAGGVVVLLFYIVAIFAEFFAPTLATYYREDYVYAPPQTLHLFRDGQFAPYVNGLVFERDPISFKKTWAIDEETAIPIGLFVKGQPYKLWGIIPMDLHLIGPLNPEDPFYLMGADKSGRDVFSRAIYSARVSLSVGLVGVALSMSLGIILGGLSGLLGGTLDNIIQRLIEVMMSIPTLPVLLAIAAVVPLDWPALRVYFIITILLALTQWTGLARVVRSK